MYLISQRNREIARGDQTKLFQPFDDFSLAPQAFKDSCFGFLSPLNSRHTTSVSFEPYWNFQEAESMIDYFAIKITYFS